jgi:hypothetical protein
MTLCSFWNSYCLWSRFCLQLSCLCWFSESNAISSPSFPIIASNESTGAVSPAGIPICKSVPSLKDSNPLLLYRFQFLQECLLRLLYRLLFLSQVATVPSVIVSLKRGIVIIVAIIDFNMRNKWIVFLLVPYNCWKVDILIPQQSYTFFQVLK